MLQASYSGCCREPCSAPGWSEPYCGKNPIKQLEVSLEEIKEVRREGICSHRVILSEFKSPSTLKRRRLLLLLRSHCDILVGTSLAFTYVGDD